MYYGEVDEDLCRFPLLVSRRRDGVRDTGRRCMSHVIIAMTVKRERMVTVSAGTEYVLCHPTHPARGSFFDLQCNLPTNQPPCGIWLSRNWPRQPHSGDMDTRRDSMPTCQHASGPGQRLQQPRYRTPGSRATPRTPEGSPWLGLPRAEAGHLERLARSAPSATRPLIPSSLKLSPLGRQPELVRCWRPVLAWC